MTTDHCFSPQGQMNMCAVVVKGKQPRGQESLLDRWHFWAGETYILRWTGEIESSSPTLMGEPPLFLPSQSPISLSGRHPVVAQTSLPTHP